MAPVIAIRDIADHVGEDVTVRGWVYNKTGKGKLAFVLLRDGTGILNCVAFKPNLDEHEFDRADKATQESSVIVTGTVRKDERAKGIPGGYELDIKTFEVLQATQDYPIGPKEHGTEFLMDNRHLWLRSSRQWAILRIRATIVATLRNWLDSNGYLLVDTPIITPAAGEETTTLFELDYFGEPAYLAQTGQLYNEANMMAFGKVYCFGPTFRAEKSKTRRHLIEFWMLEPEMAFFSLEDLMDTEEQMITAVVQRVLELHRPELELLERDVTKLESIVSPFPRISYDDAIERLKTLREQTDDPEQKELLKIEWGEDFGSPHETALTGLFDRPVFVYHYPSAVKAFYMQPVEGRPEVCRSVDLLAPEGYGEITGGSERIWDAELIDQRVSTIGISRDAYAWYLDLRRFGSVPHAGFGLGLERTVAWICGLQHVRETIPYARMLNRKYP
ncbi:MAG: asparagine--tRNA ligase [Chloroflexi bacterium]|nr:asparagine--tRNA ligase [Chloroflexota bacterium]MBV6434900.1 Asparagine--tRNA ligase [Anaerolineae bacterium]MDL1916292.1 asparagine--tRNA ligase [Anaerolineae bacterium CFX4]MCC6564538.1 asparagine--tRNA ligase [Chloroflexota bacterium]MCO6444915.1 asparagine--tRNA ligase [Anaerolineae bacterium]